MTAARDGRVEMTRTLADDVTVEDILRGARIPAGDAPWELEALSVVVEAIRRSAVEAVPATPELARRIALGDFSGVEPFPAPRRRHARRRIRRRVGAMSLRTRVAVVVAAIVTSTTGMAAAGALPDAAQKVIESVTPISFDDGDSPGHVDGPAEDAPEDPQSVDTPGEDAPGGQPAAEEAPDQADEPGDQDGPEADPVVPEPPAVVPVTPEVPDTEDDQGEDEDDQGENEDEGDQPGPGANNGDGNGHGNGNGSQDRPAPSEQGQDQGQDENGDGGSQDEG